MELNADFSKRAAVHGGDTAWTPSPMPGVERRMLDRIGDEVARATTIVRYAPQSRFSPHTHDGGEEFLVLEGVFQDEYGDYPTATYVRNPPTSTHTPRSDLGCTILVKLWQFDPDDRTHVCMTTGATGFASSAGNPGVAVLPLFTDSREDVRLEHWSPDARPVVGDAGGIELFVLEGGFTQGSEVFRAQSWLRLPPGETEAVVAAAGGCKLWIKSGHLGGGARSRGAT